MILISPIIQFKGIRLGESHLEEDTCNPSSKKCDIMVHDEIFFKKGSPVPRSRSIGGNGFDASR
jgi:hypothetical protein